MLIDMIHDNHGEPLFKTRFREPAALAAYGYNAIAIPDALAALPSTFPPPDPAAAGTGTRLADLTEAIDRRVAKAAEHNLQVYFYADAFLLPRTVVEANPAAFYCDTTSGSRPPMLCAAKPAVYDALQHLLTELFQRWPAAVGIIMRTAEVYPEATPHMVGNAVHESSCPSCRSMNAVARYQRFIRAMYDRVVKDLHKTYVHRTWHRASSAAPTMHDDPDVYRQVTAELPKSDHLIFSFKFTRGDFKPGQPWNPILMADWEGQQDIRPKWVEFQCEREYEGKAAFPNFQAPLWRAFLEASNLLEKNPNADKPKPERTIAHPLGFPEPPTPAQVLRPHVSLWGWSRGGGWGGPYAQREEWVDANVYALGQLHRDPTLAPKTIARNWLARTFSVDAESAAGDVITDILLRSAATVHNLVSSSLPALADAAWVRDDHFDVDALWAACARLLDTPTADKACDEKLAAFQSVEHMRRMFEHIAGELPNPAQARDLANTLTFYNSFAGALAHTFCGFVRYFQWQRTGKTSNALADQAAVHLENAQAHWQHHTQRHAMLPGAPSIFHETSFWERTNTCLQELAAAEGA